MNHIQIIWYITTFSFVLKEDFKKNIYFSPFVNKYSQSYIINTYILLHCHICIEADIFYVFCIFCIFMSCVISHVISHLMFQYYNKIYNKNTSYYYGSFALFLPIIMLMFERKNNDDVLLFFCMSMLTFALLLRRKIVAYYYLCFVPSFVFSFVFSYTYSYTYSFVFFYFTNCHTKQSDDNYYLFLISVILSFLFLKDSF